MAPRTTTTAPRRPPLNSKTPYPAASTIPSPLRFKIADKTCQHRLRPSRSPDGTSSSTPPLVRHNSSSSRSESTTSPMTPEYSSDLLDLQNKSTPYFTHVYASRHNGQLYPNMQPAQNPFATSYHFYPSDMVDPAITSNGVGALNQQALLNLPPPLSYPIPEPSMTASSPVGTPATYHQSTSPTSTTLKFPPTKKKSSSQSASTQTNSSSSPTTSSGPPKKKFPCPHATRFRCADTFTTSGHAARHGKKHTGEKSVVCPTCNKAFTRKDNMKQHERTHKNTTNRKLGDNATPSNFSSSHAHPSRPARDGRSRSPSAANSSLSAETESSGFDFAVAPPMHRPERDGAIHGSRRAARTNGRVSTGSRRSEEDGEGESPGLDALAAAAGMG